MARFSHSSSPDRLKQPAAKPQGTVHPSPPVIWMSKLGLRAASIAFCVLIVGLSGGIGGLLLNPEHYLWFFMIQMGPVALFTVLWDIAESICILVRGGHRGMHPGAIVGMDLALSIALIAITAYTGYWEFDLYSADEVLDKYDKHPSNLDTVSMGKAIIAFGALAFLVHVGLFVVGCYETNVRRKTRGIAASSSV